MYISFSFFPPLSVLHVYFANLPGRTLGCNLGIYLQRKCEYDDDGMFFRNLQNYIQLDFYFINLPSSPLFKSKQAQLGSCIDVLWIEDKACFSRISFIKIELALFWGFRDWTSGLRVYGCKYVISGRAFQGPYLILFDLW